jgi:sialate O-acetylesterase
MRKPSSAAPRFIHGIVASLLFFGCLAIFARAADELPAIFSDHMVLQRDEPIRVWGRSAPGTSVRVSFGGHEVTTMAPATKRWEVELSPLPASAIGRVLVIQAEEMHRFDDVLVGDVWLFSGQSNMNRTVVQADRADEELADVQLPAVRLFQVGHRIADAPQFRGEGRWELSSRQSVENFSAIAFFTGRGLWREYGIPVGVIQCTWSGSRIKPWLPWEVLASRPHFRTIIEDWKKELADFPKLKAEFEANLPKLRAQWETEAARARATGNEPPTEPQLRTGPGTRYQPGGIYAGMIAPLAPFPLKGVAWYQGESDVSRAALYRELLPAMIESWRTVFRNERLPFVVVQLPNLRRGAEPAGGGWPRMREAQLQVGSSMPAVRLVTTIDVGDPANLHPKAKQPVAARIQAAFGVLALGAKNPEARLTPVPEAHSSDGTGGIRIQFGPRGIGLALVGAMPGLVISGDDRHFVPGNLHIDGDVILVSSPVVARPVSVRYAWGANPVAGLSSKAGIPLSPFRLDDWPDDSVTYSKEARAAAFRP